MKIINAYEVFYKKSKVKYFIVETKYGICKITEKDYISRKVTNNKECIE